MIERRVLTNEIRCRGTTAVIALLLTLVPALVVWPIAAWYAEFLLVIGPILGFVPVWQVVGLVYGKHIQHKIALEAKSKMIEFVGESPEHIDTSCALTRDKKGFVGTGIAIKDDSIYFLDRGEIAKIPSRLIREWHLTIPGYTLIETRGGNAGDGVKDLEHNTTSFREAYDQSGLFVRVADVSKPVWQFTSRDKQVLDRWCEILTQVNERRSIAAGQ